MFDEMGWRLLVQKLARVDTAGTRSVVIDAAEWRLLIAGAALVADRDAARDRAPTSFNAEALGLSFADACAVAALALQIQRADHPFDERLPTARHDLRVSCIPWAVELIRSVRNSPDFVGVAVDR